MDIIIALLIGLAIGILTAYLIANRRYTALRIMSEATATSLHHTTVDLQGKNEQVLTGERNKPAEGAECRRDAVA